MHGYDVTDPTEINEELGGRAGFEELSEGSVGLWFGLDTGHCTKSCLVLGGEPTDMRRLGEGC